MDQTPQPPMPPTEPAAPTSPTEPVAPPTPPTPPTATPNSVMPPTPSSNKGLIIGLVVGGVILLLVIVGIVLAVVLGSKNTNNNAGTTKNQGTSNQQSPEPSEDSLRSANAETATSLSNFDAVCENGSISNAADFVKPYKVAAFSKNSTTRSYSTVSLSYSADYAGKYGEHEKVNVVACLDEKEGTAVKSKTCDFKSGNENITLDFYALKYNLSVREAKTGKLIKDLGEVNGPATSCPFVAAYNKSDPKYYAKPDSATVDAAIKKFVSE